MQRHFASSRVKRVVDPQTVAALVAPCFLVVAADRVQRLVSIADKVDQPRQRVGPGGDPAVRCPSVLTSCAMRKGSSPSPGRWTGFANSGWSI